MSKHWANDDACAPSASFTAHVVVFVGRPTLLELPALANRSGAQEPCAPTPHTPAPSSLLRAFFEITRKSAPIGNMCGNVHDNIATPLFGGACTGFLVLSLDPDPECHIVEASCRQMGQRPGMVRNPTGSCRAEHEGASASSLVERSVYSVALTLTKTGAPADAGGGMAQHAQSEKSQPLTGGQPQLIHDLHLGEAHRLTVLVH